MSAKVQIRNRLISDIRDAYSAVAVEPAIDEIALLDGFARSTWSGLGEPGDSSVGLLVRSLGPWAALELVIEGAAANHLARAVADLGDEITHEGNDELIARLEEALERWRPRLVQSEALAHLIRAKRVDARLVTPVDPAWPPGLHDLAEHAPVALWLRGDLGCLGAAARSISIVGARASTGYGEHVTMESAAGLVERGYGTVSGGAYGIDGMAHRTTLATEGTTIAVLAGGIDRLYPSGHDALLRRIIETGALITELPCGFAPTKWRFLQRNRLIAAISQATVVVEAGWRSGSLNTAHHALELDRPVGAVPGPVTSASSAGCHRLLRETPAVCVTTAEEMAQLVHPQVGVGVESHVDQAQSIHPFAIRVLDALSSKAYRTTEKLAASAGLSLAETTAVLGLLDMNRLAHEDSGGWRKSSS